MLLPILPTEYRYHLYPPLEPSKCSSVMLVRTRALNPSAKHSLPRCNSCGTYMAPLVPIGAHWFSPCLHLTSHLWSATRCRERSPEQLAPLSVSSSTPSLLSTVFIVLFLVATVTSANELPSAAELTLHRQINLIHELNLSNVHYSGLSVEHRQGHSNMVYLHDENSRNVRFSLSVCRRAAELISRSKDFTFLVTMKQVPHNTGVIFAFADGIHRVLEIQSSGRRKELRFHYRIEETVFSESFPVDLADDSWHKVALTISDVQLDLYIDCVHRFRRQIQPFDYHSLHRPNLTLWLGQRGLHHFMYQGYLKDARIIASSNGFRAQCPDLETACPTCGQFKTMVDRVSQLESTVEFLTKQLLTLQQRVSNLESCECARSCRINGTVHSDGSSWKDKCNICTCTAGEVNCKPLECTSSCRQSQQSDPCCSKCKKRCYFGKKSYNDGVRFNYTQPHSSACAECRCSNGKVTCAKFSGKCPELHCNASKWIQPEGQCCMICEGTDFCAQGHGCHPDAECHNLRANYTCLCKPGFRGSGHTCDDIDECAQQKHKCLNAVCVNKPGSYECRCKPGYTPVDDHNCIDIDECSTNQHKCSEQAICTNSPGGYQCHCKEGYEGNGQVCKPVCKHSCLNGGQCIAPNTCSCRKGYYGHRCEADIDECALGLHQCPANSKCFNKPGWYRCQCDEGYEAKREMIDGSSFDLECQDVDECLNPLLNTCPANTRCVNLKGSYRCECNSTSSSETSGNEVDQCSDSCIANGMERSHGERWPLSSREPCTQCHCHRGVVTCRATQCDCSRSNFDLQCCPQCRATHKVCFHQENRNTIFKSGQQWNYDCQTCECMNGEIDCWNECPPVTCLNPIRVSGDCCMRCEDDPCQSTSFKQTSDNSSLAGCRHLDREYQSGQTVQLQEDSCASCLCQNGRLCCSYTFPCVAESNQLELPSAATSSRQQYAHANYTEGDITYSDLGHFIKRFLIPNAVDLAVNDENNLIADDLEKGDNEDDSSSGSHEIDHGSYEQQRKNNLKKQIARQVSHTSAHYHRVHRHVNQETDEPDDEWSHEMASRGEAGG